MRHVKEHWFPLVLCIVILFVTISNLNTKMPAAQTLPVMYSIIPDLGELTGSEHDDLVCYGKDLVDNTSDYFGPRGSIQAITNGLNCTNCHRESGMKLYSNNFLAVASTYPKFRPRSGMKESVEFRVNDCMQRSLDGSPIDTASKEMKAMVAYIKWTGKNVLPENRNDGPGSRMIEMINRAADPVKGKQVYATKCFSCHGMNGEGAFSYTQTSYTYPPLWGENSYAVSAGMYRNSVLASFIKYNMPLGATYNSPAVSDEEAWDLAAFINSQPHPDKKFSQDWPDIASKPFDYPFGPYADNFSEQQHKYGPYHSIIGKKK